MNKYLIVLSDEHDSMTYGCVSDLNKDDFILSYETLCAKSNVSYVLIGDKAVPNKTTEHWWDFNIYTLDEWFDKIYAQN